MRWYRVRLAKTINFEITLTLLLMIKVGYE